MGEWTQLFADNPVLREAFTAIVVIFMDFCALMILLAAGRERKRCDHQWAKEGRGYMLVSGQETYPLGAAEILIGRHPGADIRFSDAAVSRFHALLVLFDGNWHIQDLGAGSGTFVNGVRIQKSRVLRVNDQIRVGTCVLTVVKGSGRGVEK